MILGKLSVVYRRVYWKWRIIFSFLASQSSCYLGNCNGVVQNIFSIIKTGRWKKDLGWGERNKPHAFQDSKETSKISDFPSLVCIGNSNSRTLFQGCKWKFVYKDVHQNIIIVKKNQIHPTRPATGNWFNNGDVYNIDPSNGTEHMHAFKNILFWRIFKKHIFILFFFYIYIIFKWKK